MCPYPIRFPKAKIQEKFTFLEICDKFHFFKVSIENFGRSFFAYAMFFFLSRVVKRKPIRIFSSIICSEIPPSTSTEATVLHFFSFPLSSFLYALIQYIPRTHTRTHRKSVVCILLQCDCHYIIIRGIARNAIDLPVYLENNLLRIRHDLNKYHT